MCTDIHRWLTRIIPARAGFTPLSHSPNPSIHGSSPLARGLRDLGSGDCGAGDGSSPLARGLRHSGARAWGSGRIIPARAGFTYLPVTDVRWTSGSSPLARGLQFGGAQRRGGQGIIPARAGFTDGSACIEAFQRDHPRSRGVYVRAWRMCSSVTGSSPLARGLHRRQWVSIMGARIIPARAGFTPPDRRRRGRLGDHPRSRGVYGLFIGLYVSPRRIIPARAGFT